VKRIDYYAQPQPWKVPKWMGVTLGVIFSAVAVMAVALIVHLTRPAHADTPPAVAQAAVAAPQAPAPVVTEPPVQTAAAPAVGSAPKASIAHAKHAKLQKKAKAVASGHAKSRAILARHDSRDKRKQKDDLDRMLGL
jgi:hypothetical protein